MEQRELNIHIAGNYDQWLKANEVFKQPFDWLQGILKNMTGFSYPSGYAIISRNNIVKNIWVGDTNEFALYNELRQIDSCIYIDNYEGPERAIRGWKNLSRTNIEETFNIRFSDKHLAELGGFPSNLTIAY